MRIQQSLAIVLLTCTSLLSAFADDTEIFVTGFDAPVACEAPNVLFVIDTSGSMDSAVLTQVDWDPNTSFGGCFDSDRLYYSATGDLPDCSSLASFPRGNNACDAATAGLERVGRYKSLFRSWNADRELWEQLEAGSIDGPVECEPDRGVHGDGSNGDNFAADGSGGPWAAGSTTEPAWASASNVTLFDGNWLNWNSNPPTVEKTRLEVVQEVTNAAIDGLSGVNVGVMRFNGDEGGAVIEAVDDIATNRDSTQQAISDLAADGRTPLSETLYEAGQYLAQRNVDFGNTGSVRSVAEARLGGTADGPTYRSPIEAEGQQSFVVLLTDGEAEGDGAADSKIQSLPGFGQLIGSDCDGTGQGRCLDDMAEYLFKHDLRPDIPGLQNVTTHTIGFTLDLDLLRDTASRGGGRYFQAENSAGLTAALTDLADSFNRDAGVFAAPAVAVNSFNRSTTFDDVFVAVFEPSATVRWPGNLKKYRIGSPDDPAAPANIELQDQDGLPAVDPNTGFFLANSRSFWSSEVDGDRPRLGGAASRLPDPDERRVYTDIVSGDLNALGGANELRVGNTAISAAKLGAADNQRDQVIEWARGRDVLDEDGDGDTLEARLSMGDPLHARPATVIYGGTENLPDATVFVSTNDGYLHAIDSRSGDELWAFIPQRLLSRMYPLLTNNISATRTYGLDGDITVFIENSNGEPGITGDERVILLFGMRRGGDAVYAMDVTDRANPRVLWEIDSSQPGFASLGQTWSTPRVAKVNIGGTTQQIVLFAGGYDTGQDNRSFRQDNVGNAIYMVDLATGSLLWSASNNGGHDLQLARMNFSIPAGLTALDFDGDDLIDRIFFGDLGGQVWRLDVRNGNPANTLVDGGVLASLGGADLDPAQGNENVRRFYNSADVVRVIDGQSSFAAINIGSGYRAHPLDTDTQDEFFSIRDYRIFDPLTATDFNNPITIDQLVDVTNDVNAELGDEAGWRLRMVQGAGEKILNRSVTFANTVFITSFQPGSSANACAPSAGINRVYQVGIRAANPITNLDRSIDGDITETDRFVTLRQGGIAPELTFLFPDNTDGPALLAGPEQVDRGDVDSSGAGPGSPRSWRRSFWLQRELP